MPRDSLESARVNDLALDGADSAGPVDVSSVVGTWFNVNRASSEIVGMEIAEQSGGLGLQIFGASDGPEPIVWPQVVATPFVSSPRSTELGGFEAHCDLGFMEAHLAANLKNGVLVLQSYNRFKDGSGRASYFTREFYSQHVTYRSCAGSPLVGAGGGDYRMAADVASAQRPAGRIDLSPWTGR